MSARGAWAVLPLIFTLACTSGPRDDYRPSLTMVRIGEVVADDVLVPEALYVPGINVNSEDYELEGDNFRLPANGAGGKTDLSAMAEVDDPEPLEKHVEGYPYAVADGDLFDQNADEGLLEYTDVEQGAIGDCYMVAALSAVLYADEDNLVREGIIREVVNGQGQVTHFVVRFYDAYGDPQDIEVDAELVRKGSRVTYARSTDTTADSEEWGISLIEKAYAKWHGGYEEIGNGGWAGDVMQALTGAKANYRNIKWMSDDTIINSIASAVEENRPVVAGTFGKEDGVDYAGTGVYAWHAYTVLGSTKASGDEEAKVKLRNPWASSEPAGNGEDDGIFELTLTDFKTLYQGLTFGGSYSADRTAPDEIVDLKLTEISAENVATITFTAPGDDGDSGLAKRYDVRLGTDEIVEADSFYSFEQLFVGDPQVPGTLETIEVPMAADGTIYTLAIRAEDESGNLGPISDVLWFDATTVPEGDDDTDTE